MVQTFPGSSLNTGTFYIGISRKLLLTRKALVGKGRFCRVCQPVMMIFFVAITWLSFVM